MMRLLSTVTPYLLILSSVTSQEPALSEDDFPVVLTSYGPVQGLKFVSPWTKKAIYSFRGIPYATPPLNELRFKDPIPPEKWSTVKNCTQDENACPQVDFFGLPNSTLSTNEDCLFINVYTPQVKPVDGLLPVMVWVHGGGFYAGSGNYNETGPDFLVGEGVVVVTFNYRLGALGFLSLEIPGAPGNAGMKDQLLALQWVQREIQQFGGDKGSVTLFGESAGSAAVHLHYLSPLSTGLFHRVIGESGTALTSWSVRSNAAVYGLKLAAALNCSTADSVKALKCLTTTDVQEIVDAQQRLTLTEEDIKNGLSLVFVPSIDKASKKPFLPYYPRKLLEQGEGSFVPFIMGINSDEGMMALGMTKDEERIKNITNNLERFIPPEVKNQSTESRLAFLVKKIKQFYFQDTVPSSSNLRGYVDLNTDFFFGYSTAVSARAFRDRADVYLYMFAFNGAFKERVTEIVMKTYNFSGVSHAEELSYLFVRQKVNQTATEDSTEMKTWKQMAKLWTNFGKYGTPTVGTDPELDSVAWFPVGNVTMRYLQINGNLTMISNDYLGSRVALWDSITPSRSGYLQATAVLIILLTTIILYLTK
uniref:Carboxylic ester hydrolase n=1 Tax=Cuerna arida TaxID=1464854 RepID=A0A1B6GS61_9HEMI